MTMQEHNEEIRFQIGEVTLAGTLGMPEQALGIVLFAHGSGSSRHSPRNRFVAATLRKAGLGTLLFDLLTRDQEAEDLVTGRMRFDIPFLVGRLLGHGRTANRILRIEHGRSSGAHRIGRATRKNRGNRLPWQPHRHG